MTELLLNSDIKVIQKDLSQIIVRGKGDGNFAETINKEISLLPPSDNLRCISNEKFLFSKQSFDQWSLIAYEELGDDEVIKLISNLNMNDQILASNYSLGQSYFEFEGKNKNHFLNKLTHFDLRNKNFPVSSMAQTLLARIDCSIYHLNNKFLVTINKSFEDYFIKRIKDSINL
tara:strand:- start:505 stop:1026 length:522 start_codon:yes stop_codon:yes gene_type:complete